MTMGKATTKTDRILGKVIQIGVELEGAFEEQRERETYHHDGSVDLSQDYGFVGEVVSPPLNSIEQILDWVELNYPTKTNSSCGAHVHVSFNTRLAYMQTMSQSFYDYFYDRMGKWGKKAGLSEKSSFWNRLAGSNSFCRKMPKSNKTLMAQIQKQNGDYGSNRYYQLNHCWSKHRTLECRLLPCFKDMKFTKAGIREFVWLCDAYLKRQRKEPEYTDMVEFTVDNENKVEVICI